MLAKSLAVLALTLGPSAEGPFQNLTFEQARAAAERDGKILLVDFFTTWCPPCKRLDAVTWKDPAVLAWLAEKTVALKIDAEKERELARGFGIESYPTLLFVKPDGKEFDRIVGYRDPEDFLQEANEALAGKNAAARELDKDQREIAQAKEKLAGHENDPMARGNYADALARTGRHAEALAEYLWCFDHGLEHDPAYYGVRLSFLISEIFELGRDHPPAIAALEARRDKAEEGFASGAPSRSDAADMIALNELLGSPDRILKAYERAKLKGPLDEHSKRAFVLSAPETLIEPKRYAEFLDLVGVVEDHVENRIQSANLITERNQDETDERLKLLNVGVRAKIIQETAVCYEALLGTDRLEEAARVAAKFLEADPSDSMYAALIGHAARAGHADEARAWVEKARSAIPEKERRAVERAARKISAK
jgi:thiol-disulfide isomerase/thioredoxin